MGELIQFWWTQSDRNKDGRVTLEELIEGMWETQKETNPQESDEQKLARAEENKQAVEFMRKIFPKADEDRNGFLKFSEMHVLARLFQQQAVPYQEAKDKERERDWLTRPPGEQKPKPEKQKPKPDYQQP